MNLHGQEEKQRQQRSLSTALRKKEVALEKTELPEDLTAISKVYIKGGGNPSVLLNGFLELHQSEREPCLISHSLSDAHLKGS